MMSGPHHAPRRRILRNPASGVDGRPDRAGERAPGFGELVLLAGKVLDRLRADGRHLATAESCTGGLVSAALTEVPGSSDAFDRGFVTYSNGAKEELLGVCGAVLAEFGAVSQEVARQMATGAVARSAADVAVSVTGVAGPGSSGRKPEGRVCFAVAVGASARSWQVDFGPVGRARVRRAAAGHALNLLLREVPAG